jgi:organic radical activating enzyme
MDKLVEWEITMKCNYSCGYCTNLDKSIYPNLDNKQIYTFIEQLGKDHPGTEIFVFGGEPFVHPKIDYILYCFNLLKIPFVVQTNFSKHSREVMKTINHPFRINISVHPSEVDIEDVVDGLYECDQSIINIIDVMYVGATSLSYYFTITKAINHPHIYLTPIADFGDGISDTVLDEYNKLRDKFSKAIKFEDVERLGRQRSEVWADRKFNTINKPSLYKDKYFLYGPDFRLHNCCYRITTDGICPKTKCFLM